MSLGVKRKLAIVAAFMSDPDVLILDEPTSGLDPVMQEVFIQYIKEEKKKSKELKKERKKQRDLAYAKKKYGSKNIINNNDEINKAHIGKYKLLIFNHSYLFFIISMFFFKNKIKTT